MNVNSLGSRLCESRRRATDFLARNATPGLNQLYLRQGRWLAPGRDDEVLASEAFALANNLHVGDSISAVINGRQKQLGSSESPSRRSTSTRSSRATVARQQHFGVFWMNHEALSIAYDLDGAFNDLTLSLLRGASSDEVLKRRRRPHQALRRPRAPTTAKDQPSHNVLDNEIDRTATWVCSRRRCSWRWPRFC